MTKVVLNVTVDPVIKKELEKRAKAKDRTVSYVTNEVLAVEFRKTKTKKPKA